MATMFTHSNGDVMHTNHTVLRCYAEQHVSMETWLYIRIWSSFKTLIENFAHPETYMSF